MATFETVKKRNMLERLSQKDFAKFPFDEPREKVIMQAMLEFAQRKCAEQRSLCARAYEKADWVELNQCVENILNAEEPKYE